MLGAHRAGIKTIIIPKGNEADNRGTLRVVSKTLEFHPVETLKRC